MAPPAAPASGSSKRTFVRFYQANQDSALASFLQQQPQQSNNGSATGQRHIRRHAVEVEADEPPDESGADSPGQPDLDVNMSLDVPSTSSSAPISNSISTSNENHSQSTVTRAINDEGMVGINSDISEVKDTALFIEALHSATLEKSGMDPDHIVQLRDAPSDFSFDVHDPHFLFPLRTFFAVTNSSQDTYNKIHVAALDCYPDNPFPSFNVMKRRVESISGVNPITHDMCINSCIAYTGPYADRDTCFVCGQSRYDDYGSKPRRQFDTIPIRPVLQALYRSPESAKKMRQVERTASILRMTPPPSEEPPSSPDVLPDFHDPLSNIYDDIDRIIETPAGRSSSLEPPSPSGASDSPPQGPYDDEVPDSPELPITRPTSPETDELINDIDTDVAAMEVATATSIEAMKTSTINKKKSRPRGPKVATLRANCITARNECMADWLETHAGGLEEDFNKHFATLSKPQKKIYNAHAKMKKNGPVPTT